MDFLSYFQLSLIEIYFIVFTVFVASIIRGFNGFGLSAMYSSFFIIPHYLLSFFGIIVLGFIIERMLKAANSGSSIMTACFVYWFVQSVTFINGALSWALLNVIASYLVLKVLVYINQIMFFRRSNF